MLLRQMLYRTEVRLLPVIASFWIRMKTPADYEELIRILSVRIPDPVLLRRLLTGEGGEELSEGLKYLSEHEGRQTVESFEAVFGPMRVAGIEKTLREKYWKAPLSLTEKLFYRGLIFRENRVIGGELKECFILPDDLREILSGILPDMAPRRRDAEQQLIIRPAAPSETASVSPLCSGLPDLFTLAAALKRSERPLAFPGKDLGDPFLHFIEMLLFESGMFFTENGSDPELIRQHLIRNRTAARLDLIRIWRNSSRYDEIEEDKEHFRVITAPEYDRRLPRAEILKLLSALNPDTWWSLSGFISAVKSAAPLFLRGSFTQGRGSIQDPDGNDLSGIGSWFQFEAAYIRFLICGPLYWLGITQTACADSARQEASAFRISAEALFFLTESEQAETAPDILAKPNLERGIPNIASDGSITCSSDVPRYFRYMAARCCEIEKLKGDTCIFRITPGSLAAAEKAGISREAFLSLLKRFSKRPLPPSLERMLSANDKAVLPATIYNAVILTIPQQAVLEDLLETSRLEKWILQQINQTSLMIDPKGIDEIRRFLMEKEIFVDIQR